MTETTEPKDVKVAEASAKVAEHLVESKAAKFDWKKFWTNFKDKFARYGGALVMEKDKKDQWVISIGRVSWWLTFLPALYIFIAAFQASTDVKEAADVVARDITPNHLTILLALAGYNFGKRVVDAAGKIFGKTSGDDGPG